MADLPVVFSFMVRCGLEAHVRYIGGRIEPDDKVGLGNLARYIIRAC